MYFAFLYVYLILLANYVFSWAKQTYLESSCRDILLPTLASWYSGHHNFHMYQENWKWLTQDVIMPASSINFGKSISWYCSEWLYHETIHWNINMSWHCSQLQSGCVLTFTIQGYQTNQHQHRVNLEERKRFYYPEIPPWQITKELEACS